MKRIVMIAAVIVVVGALWAQAPPVAPEPSDLSAAEAPEGKEISLWRTIRAGGIIGLIILLESLVALGLIVEHFLTLRRSRFVPEVLEQQAQSLLDEGNVAAVLELCKGSQSLLGITMAVGLERHGGVFGFFNMQSAMQEAAEREVARMHRKLEYITFIAATAPMMGLLGTVMGMMSSFNVISITGGAAKPSQLAGGISEALVTTCMGLIVAIPTMFFASLFRNRIDSCVAETEAVCERLTSGFRSGGPTE